MAQLLTNGSKMGLMVIHRIRWAPKFPPPLKPERKVMKIFGNSQNFKHFNPGDRKSPGNVFYCAGYILQNNLPLPGRLRDGRYCPHNLVMVWLMLVCSQWCTFQYSVKGVKCSTKAKCCDSLTGVTQCRKSTFDTDDGIINFSTHFLLSSVEASPNQADYSCFSSWRSHVMK